MSYKPKDISFPVVVEGNVKQTGSSLNLGVGEVAFVDLSNGVKVLTDFSPLSPTAKLAIRMGEPKDNVSRSEDNKPISTIPFKLKDVVNIYVDAPERTGVLVDDFIIGYNGKDGSEISLDNSENEVIELCLTGNLMGMIGLPDNKHTIRIDLTAPTEGVKNDTLAPTDPGYDAAQWTDHEIVEQAYLRLKDRKLPGNINLLDYVDIMLVNSDNPTTLPGTASTYYTLSVADNGTYTDLGKIQGQYGDNEVKKLTYKNGISTYTTVATSAPADYQAKTGVILKGCEDCPTGYTELSQGFVYEVVIESTDDLTADVQAITGATAGTAILNDTVGDTNTYSVVADAEFAEADIAAFITANPSASINLIAEDVTDLCTGTAPAAISWVVGESCNVTTEAYTITLRDTECDETRLPELIAYYEDAGLTITEVTGTDNACQRTYSTTVTTSLVCEECDPIFRDVFESEAPEAFEGIHWEKEEKQYSGTAKMGIRVRGKRASLSGNLFLVDDMPFIDDSVEISLVGGFPTETNESYLSGTNDRFTVKYFSRKAGAHNLGGNLRKYEDESQVHFRGRKAYVGNNYAKIVNGQETRLEGLTNYITYSITIAPFKYASNFQQGQTNAFTYHFPVEPGKQEDFETIINKLATAAGIPTVQAIAK